MPILFVDHPPPVDAPLTFIEPQEMSPDAFVCSACPPVHVRTFASESVEANRPVPFTSSIFAPLNAEVVVPTETEPTAVASNSPPANVEVALDVELIEPSNNCPMIVVELSTATEALKFVVLEFSVTRFVAYSFVLVLFVVEAFVAYKFVDVELVVELN